LQDEVFLYTYYYIVLKGWPVVVEHAMLAIPVMQKAERRI
jgi:hypothetical protein